MVVGLGLVELGIELDRGHDRAGERAEVVEQLDVRLGGAALVVVLREDRRAVLRADVVALPVQLGRVVGDGEEDLEELALRGARGVVGDANRLGVLRPT